MCIGSSWVFKDHTFTFRKDGTTICRYNTRSNEIEELFDNPNFINQEQFDGREFFITEDYVNHSEDGADFYWYALETGEIHQFQEDDTEVMIFSIFRETKDNFIGLLDGKMRLISKQDFCNENWGASYPWPFGD